MPVCEHNRRLNAYHDGELAADERRDLEAHLQQCAPCRAELERLGSLSRLLAGASIPQMPPGALERLHGSVGSARTAVVVRMAQRLTAAAAAVLVVCAVCLWLTGGIQGRGAALSEGWEIAAVSLQAEVPAEAGTEELLGQWIVADLSLENGSD